MKNIVDVFLSLHSMLETLWDKICTAAFVLFVFLSNIHAQHNTEIFLSNGESVMIEKPSDGFNAITIENGRITSVNKENDQELLRVIIIFKDQPISVYRSIKNSLSKSSISALYNSLRSSHQEFRSALNAIKQKLMIQSNSDFGYTITHDYYYALNGISMECKRGMLSRIKELPIVKSISLDQEVKADLAQSIHQIRADVVQDSMGYTGKGILVGVIDTGIDFNNPFLGGGIGPLYRTISGYNFINKNTPPLDDNGHGTHVAGIIGANGGKDFRGVAPDVNFLAVKVLDSEGRGVNSDVIAGIDYCLDPDNNPETNDAVDIINLSLGGSPFPGNPVDSAADNATRCGVISIASAGNSGYDRYGTINSPGTSESIVTVGACDSTNAVAHFSSLGPDPIHSSIKPEVVAPGVKISSTVLNNQIDVKSGTSMAAPHVAGVAALLKQKHPDWSPSELKAAIVNTANPIGNNESIFKQGKGCVDALNAMKTELVVAPGTLSFGMVDLLADVWKASLKIMIKNYGSVVQKTQIQLIDGLPLGAELSFDNSSFSLGPGEAKEISVFLSVPSSVPILTEEPFAYSGNIKVSADSDNVIIPYSFIKSTMLVVNFELPLKMGSLFNRTKKTITTFSATQANGTKYSFMVPQGDTLEIVALLSKDTLDYKEYYIIDHKIDNPRGLTYAYIGQDEATINIVDTVYDIHNNIIVFDSLSSITLSLYMSLGNPELKGETAQNIWVIGSGVSKSRMFISPVDSSFLLEKKILTSSNLDMYILRKSVRSLKERREIAINSGPDNLVGFHLSFRYTDPYIGIPPSKLRKTIGVRSSLTTLTLNPNKGYYYNVSTEGFMRDRVDHIFFNKQNINQGLQNDKYHHYALYTCIVHNSYTNAILRSSDFNINENGDAAFYQKQIILQPSFSDGEISKSFDYETLKSGDTIKVEQNSHLNFPEGMTYIRNGSMYVKGNNNMNDQSASSGGIKQSNGSFESINQFNAYWLIPKFTAEAYTHNRLLSNKKPFRLNQSDGYYLPSYDKSYGYYEFDDLKKNSGKLRMLTSAVPYSILGQQGQCTADFEYQIPKILIDQTVQWSINLLSAAVVFPSYNLLQVSVDKKAVDIVEPSKDAIIRTNLFNPDNCITSVKLALLFAAGNEVQLPALDLGGNEYVAHIPNTIPKGFIDIIARFEDTKGNKGELIACPGFYFGNSTDAKKLDARLRMISYSLENADKINMTKGDTLQYDLTYANYGSDVAKSVAVMFPTTPYFKPIADYQNWTTDSIGVRDTIHIPLKMLFLGRQKSTDSITYYSPSITWTTGGTKYVRDHKILVDFQNEFTSITRTELNFPLRYELYQNFPNPFNPNTTIKYDIPKESNVKIVVYDILGREVERLVSEYQKAGNYKVVWKANKYASGIYICKIYAGDFTATKKLILLK